MRRKKKVSLTSKKPELIPRRKKRKKIASTQHIRRKKVSLDTKKKKSVITNVSSQFPNFIDCFPPSWHQVNRHEQHRLLLKRKPRVIHPSLIETTLKFNNITVSHKLQNRLPYSKSDTRTELLQEYNKDFIYRLMFYTPQMMTIAYYAQAGIRVNDQKISDEHNRLQFELFNSMGRVTQKSLQFPRGYPQKVSDEEIDSLVIRLTQNVTNSCSTYLFRYTVLKFFWIIPSIRKHIQKMIPHHKFYVLKNILKRTFITENSLNKEGEIANADRSFNEILDLIWFVGNRYDSNYGIMLLANRKIINIHTYREIDMKIDEVVGLNADIIVNEVEQPSLIS